MTLISEISEFPGMGRKPDKVTFTKHLPGGSFRLSAEGDCEDLSTDGIAEFFARQTKVKLTITLEIDGIDAAERVRSF